MPFTPADDGLLRVVLEDLRYIKTSWGGGGIEDNSLRRDSAVLRRFLHHRDLLKAWNTVMGLGKPFLVPAGGILITNQAGLPEIDFASCSEVDQPGIKTFAVSVKTGALESEHPISLVPAKPIKLKRFVHGYCCVVGGVPIKRNDVVQFVANKLGGAHYDTDRQKPDAAALSRLEAYAVAGRNAVYYELLGIGQALADSESCGLLLDGLEKRCAL